MESIKFHFQGRLADNHELNFYEAARFQYATARFILALEKFRQEKKVIYRLNSKVDADIRIRASERGSFIQEIFVAALPAIESCAIQVPLEAMMSYAWSKLFPQKPADKEIAIKLAEIELARERERTAQHRLTTDQHQMFLNVIETQNASLQQSLAIIEQEVTSNRQPEISGRQISRQELILIRDRLKANLEREKTITQYSDEFSTIDTDSSNSLCGQLRKAVPDMTLPLRSSANQMNISGKDARSPIAALDFETGKSIGEDTLDQNLITMRGKIKSFDREQATGKFRYNDTLAPISFSVASERKTNLLPKVILGLQMKTILVSAQFVRDTFGNVKSVIIWDLFPEEGEN